MHLDDIGKTIFSISIKGGAPAIPRDVRDLRVDALGFIYHMESLFSSTKFNIAIHIWNI